MKHISFLLPDLRAGGAEKVALLLANEFIKQGYSVDMVLCTAHGEFLYALDKNIQVFDLNALSLRHIFKALVVYLKEQKPDVFIPMMWPLTVVGVVAFKATRLTGQSITSDHTTFSQSPIMKRRLMRWFFKCSVPLVYPLAEGRLAVSNGVAEDLAVLGRLKRDSIKVIYNPISLDTKYFTKEQSEQAWQDFSGKKIVAVGALKWAKDYPSLLKAFALLLQKEQAMLSIVGQGDLLSELEALTKRLGIDKHVYFVGFSDMPYAWMASADLLVLSSHYEGFGNVLVEAMSVGTPVVSTDCKSGPREILCDGKYGKLVPIGDIEALAEAMFDSLQEEHEVEALKLCAASFSVDKIAEQYLDVMFPGRLKKNV